MRNKLLFTIAIFGLLSSSDKVLAEAPNLGTASGFVLFSANGAVTNTGISHVTGNVGTNRGSSTGFGNVNGVMHDGDLASGRCAADLRTAYNQLNSAIATFFPAPLLGNGQTLHAGVYSISSAATLNGDLILDGQGDANAVFIIKIRGAFSTSAASKVKLINSALACNVYWKVEGLVSMASGTSMKGTVIANNAAISMGTNDTLEGRALSTAGAVTLDGMLAYIPTGCGSAVLRGPAAPSLGSAECYVLFSSDGAVANSGITHLVGDVGTNVGLTTGFDTSLVVGHVHPIPDVSTAACAADLHTAYTYLNTLPYDIQLLYPAQFGRNLVLTPHTYLLNAATMLTDTVILDARGNANAVFVIKINGALSTSTYSAVQLINGAQSKNVYWKVEGAVSINNYSVFRGTLVCNNGALNAINTGVVIDGRAFTTNGAVTTIAMTAIMTPGCSSGAPSVGGGPGDQTVCAGSTASFSIMAHGSGLSYQWRKGNANLANGANISGAQSAILTIASATAADAATDYNVVISGPSGPVDTSSYAALIVIQPSVNNITAQIANGTAYVVGVDSFRVRGIDTITMAGAAASGCDSMVILDLTVVSCTPAVSIAANNTNLDIQSSRVITATPTDGGSRPVYIWYLNGTVISGARYSVLSFGGALGNGDMVYSTMTAATGCATGITAVSNTVTFTKSGSIAKDIILFTMPAQVGSSVINNTAATVSTVVTTAPAGRTSIHPTHIVTSPQSGYGPSYIVNRDFSMPVTYTVRAQDGSTKVWTVTVLDQSGNKTNSTVDALNVATDMNIYPNPATTYINVMAAGGTDVPVITVLDIEGRVMYHQVLPVTNTVNHMIDLSDFAAGTYFVHLAVGDRAESRAFVIAKQ